MDYESSTKFISSLAKFLQSLCNGYVEFDNGVQVIGHLYLNVDTGKSIDYVLNEKVCKTDENSVTFISNSFHAQPAEKPKPQEKKADKESNHNSDLKSDQLGNGDEVEPRSTNYGTIPTGQNYSSHSSVGSKRPLSPSNRQKNSPSGRTSPKSKRSKSDYYESGNQTPAAEGIGTSSPADPLRQQSSSLNPSFNDSYQQNFLGGDEGSLGDGQDQRDIKPSFDTDVTFIKEEYAPSSNLPSNQEDDGQGGDNSSAFSTSFSDQPFPPGAYAGPGGFPSNPRSTINPAADRSMYSSGPSQFEGADMSGDPSGRLRMYSNSKVVQSHFGTLKTGVGLSDRLYCHLCDKRFTTSRDLIGHNNARHLKTKPYVCNFCGNGFAYKRSLDYHVKSGKCHPVQNIPELDM